MAGVKILAPDGAIAPTGTWSLGTRAGDFVFVAGMRGIDPGHQHDGRRATRRGCAAGSATCRTIAALRGRQAYRLRADRGLCHRHGRLRPLVNKVQEEFWAGGPYPPRTIVEVARLNQDDIFEVEGEISTP